MSSGADSAFPRVYVRRRGRMTRAQARAVTELSPRYCLDAQAPGLIDTLVAYGREAPLGLEIGFGMGQALVDWAQQRPDWNLLGLEVYQPGLGSAMLGLERLGLDNVRLLECPAEAVLDQRLASESLDEARIFFPDPWPKKRHHKRRLLQPDFAALLASRLKPGGVVWVATDWEDYGQWMLEVLDGEPALVAERPPRIEQDRDEADAGEARPGTRFEARGRRLGHRVWDLRYRRKR